MVAVERGMCVEQGRMTVCGSSGECCDVLFEVRCGEGGREGERQRVMGVKWLG